MSVFHELVLALSSVMGDVFYLDVEGNAILDPAFSLLSPGERVAVSYLLPLASSHYRIRCWIGLQSKQGLYLQALGLGVEEVVLAPLTAKLVGLEMRASCEDLAFTELRVLLAEELFLLPHVWKTIQSIQEEGLWGPQVLSRLEACATSNSGVGELRQVYLALLNRTGNVFLNQLRAWMTSGMLRDPASELFVQENLSKPEGSWDRFEIVPSLVPRFFRPRLAERILLIGKCSLLLSFCQETNESDDKTSTVSDMRALEALVDRLNGKVTHLLWEKLFGECAFMERLHCVRSLLLMGNGSSFGKFVKSSESLFGQPPTRNAERDLNRLWFKCYKGTEQVTWDGNYANGWDGIGISTCCFNFGKKKNW